MLFGKKDTESVTLGALPQALDSLFNRKLASLEPRASGIIASLRQAMARFASACDYFEKLEAEPDTEDMWNPNTNAIKTQKAAYIAALRNIIAELQLEPGGANIYARYRTVLSAVEATADKVLRANSSFKTVLYCYSKYLGEFKKQFSYIERLRDMLREELDRRVGDYDAYVRVGDDISKLAAQTDGLDALSRSMSALAEGAKGAASDAIDKRESELTQEISARSAELSDVLGRISVLSDRISLLAAPLSKASRKFDHGSQRKRKLSYFLEDPAATIRGRQDYDEFMALLAELRKFVVSSSDIKGSQEVLGAISGIEAASVYSLIGDLDSLRERKSALDGEIRGMERIMGGLREGRDSISKTAQERERMAIEAEGITKYRMALKGQVEKAFMENYGKPISITLT